jgi:allophanate hydrolase
MVTHTASPPPLPQDSSSIAQASAAWIHRLAQPLEGAAHGPLQGLCFAVKDNIDVCGLPTTAACPAFEYTPDSSARVVQRLLDAGATLLGKTNLDQFACGLNGTRSPWGAVPNAFDPRFVSGGSSSGSAYVVATGQADFALGTDTAGSGRVPAGLNNIVGLKPSRGLISARGVVPAAQSVDAVSIFARTVSTAWQVLLSARGFDPEDPYSREIQWDTRPWGDRFSFGVPAQPEFFGDALAEAAFEQAVERLREMGGEAVCIDYRPLAEVAALLYDSALVAERYAAIRPFLDAHEDQVMEPVRSIIAAGRGYSAADVFTARTRLQALAQRISPMWTRIQTLVVPTAPTHFSIAAMQADPVRLNRQLGHYTNFVNLLDYAALSVPSSIRSDGLPFGITLIGPCGSDWRLAELGMRYQALTDLTLGATPTRMSQQPAQGLPPGTSCATVRIAVVGAHLSGMPLNGQLTERGARLLQATRTRPDYRLFALADSVPPKPGLLRVAPSQGHCIDVEVWEMPVQHYGSFVALIPPPLGIGTLALESGDQVQGFLCEPQSLLEARDISHFGGWRRYVGRPPE